MSETESLENMTTATSQESVLAPEPSGEGEKPATPAEQQVAAKLPTYAILIRRAIKALKSKTGSSKRAILKHILENNQSLKKPNAMEAIDRNLKKMLKSGRLMRDEGGRFRISPRGYVREVKLRREESRRRMLKKVRKQKQKIHEKKMRRSMAKSARQMRKKKQKKMSRVSIHKKKKLLSQKKSRVNNKKNAQNGRKSSTRKKQKDATEKVRKVNDEDWWKKFR